jgi:hypothetical protein
MKFSNRIVLLNVCLCLVKSIGCELFSSIEHLYQLVDTSIQITGSLEELLQQHGKFNKKIQMFV